MPAVASAEIAYSAVEADTATAIGRLATSTPPASAPNICPDDFAFEVSALAAANSPGLCTSVGSSVACAGRYAEPATASSQTSRSGTANGSLSASDATIT